MVKPIRYAEAKKPAEERTVTMPIGDPCDYGLYTLGWEAIGWAMTWLKQPDGPNAGDPWRFTDSQVHFILWWYACDETGTWYFTHGVRRLPKGSGKSPFAAIMALIELLAPVRFAGIRDGEAIGRPVGMPLVQIGATAESQANVNTMRMVRALVPPKKSPLIREYGLEVGKTLIYTPGGGQLSMITNSANAAEGALTTFAILDQTEAFYANNGGVELAKVVRRNVGKQKNRLLETSNAWDPGRNSTAEQTFASWKKEQDTGLRGTARTLMDVRTGFRGMSKATSTKRLIESCAHAYGDCHWADPEDIVLNHVLDPKESWSDSLRYYFNIPTAAEDSWTSFDKWDKLNYSKVEDEYYLPDGSDIVLGFDGSRTRDATALIGCEITTGFTFVVGIWETKNSEDKTDKPSEIPIAEVDEAVAYAFGRWKVWGFFADVKEWESFTKVEWPKRYREDLQVWALPNGKTPEPIAWDMRTHKSEFPRAAEMVHQEIEDASFFHDGDSVLAKHVRNARQLKTEYGVSLTKESHDSPLKIDAAVAMILARHCRRVVLGSKAWIEGHPSKKKRRIVSSFS